MTYLTRNTSKGPFSLRTPVVCSSRSLCVHGMTTLQNVYTPPNPMTLFKTDLMPRIWWLGWATTKYLGSSKTFQLHQLTLFSLPPTCYMFPWGRSIQTEISCLITSVFLHGQRPCWFPTKTVSPPLEHSPFTGGSSKTTESTLLNSLLVNPKGVPKVTKHRLTTDTLSHWPAIIKFHLQLCFNSIQTQHIQVFAVSWIVSNQLNLECLQCCTSTDITDT